MQNLLKQGRVKSFVRPVKGGHDTLSLAAESHVLSILILTFVILTFSAYP